LAKEKTTPIGLVGHERNREREIKRITRPYRVSIEFTVETPGKVLDFSNVKTDK